MSAKSHFNLKTFLRKQIARRVYEIRGTPIEICAPDNLDLLYITNEKVASSTIKANLIELKIKKFVAEGGEDVVKFRKLYEKPTSRMIKSSELENKIVFSAVRNPYSRILSAYLDKSRPGTDTFRKQFGNKRPTNFRDFLILIERLEAWRLDSHFRPQYLNLAIEDLKYNYIFFFEKITHLETFFLQKNNERFLDSKIHSTGASKLINEYYGDIETKLVNKIYEKDFNYFGYANDPNSLDSRLYDFVCYSEKFGNHIGSKEADIGRYIIIDQLPMLKKYNDFNQKKYIRNYIKEKYRTIFR